MTELLDIVVSWPSLLLVLLVFGFAPGFCLRLIVLAYPRDDPRRAELVAELYAVPRSQRPLWVAEQLEVALFEGLVRRVSAGKRGVRRGIAGLVGLLTAVGGTMLYVNEHSTSGPDQGPEWWVRVDGGGWISGYVAEGREVPRDVDGAIGWAPVLDIFLAIVGLLIMFVAVWRHLSAQRAPQQLDSGE